MERVIKRAQLDPFVAEHHDLPGDSPTVRLIAHARRFEQVFSNTGSGPAERTLGAAR
jgi:hypothetical protein